MNFEQILPRHIGAARSLYESAFPPAERRDTDDWERLMQTPSRFRAEAITATDGAFAGLLTYWCFDGFIYIEHFAVEPGLRGHGTGGAALDCFLRRHEGTPIVLEVELPDTEMARRRITFYERHGFTLLPHPYLQPTYHAGGSPLPLRLMCTDGGYAGRHFEHMRRTIYTDVYGVHASELPQA